ncbi:hypothetical protein B296_00025541 [Ensete ventricosum]|uniref:Uncharacterized protein n=1 Tax=Ensete ventricosum TaxID=4639 RepID=A0A427AT63_ENSVE|nr:hypothetical protein B296_00025541 [Ensete ventricosum]
MPKAGRRLLKTNPEHGRRRRRGRVSAVHRVISFVGLFLYSAFHLDIHIAHRNPTLSGASDASAGAILCLRRGLIRLRWGFSGDQRRRRRGRGGYGGSHKGITLAIYYNGLVRDRGGEWRKWRKSSGVRETGITEVEGGGASSFRNCVVRVWRLEELGVLLVEKKTKQNRGGGRNAAF